MTDPYKYTGSHCNYLRIDDIIHWIKRFSENPDYPEKKVIPRYCNKEQLQNCVYCKLIKNNKKIERIEEIPSFKTNPKVVILFERFHEWCSLEIKQIKKIKELYGKENVKIISFCNIFNDVLQCYPINDKHLIILQEIYLKPELFDIFKNIFKKISIILYRRAFYNIDYQLNEKKKMLK